MRHPRCACRSLPHPDSWQFPSRGKRNGFRLDENIPCEWNPSGNSNSPPQPRCGRSLPAPRHSSSLLPWLPPVVLGGKEKCLGKRPFAVDPLPRTAITGAFAHLNHFLRIVLVRAFRPDRLAFAHVETEAGLPNRDSLPDLGAQMHLDAPLGFVVSRHMIELCQIEISVELAINSRQEILVEGGCYAGVIVVCERERWDRLFEVGGQEERLSLGERCPNLAQELLAGTRSRIVDRAFHEKHQQLFAFAALRGHL